MKLRKGFVSNSSSCSFLVIGIQTPEETDKKLHEIIDFHNKMIGSNYKFEDFFNPSFKAEGGFAKKYEAYYLGHDYANFRKDIVAECNGVEGQTIIYPKVEDNELKLGVDMISTYSNSLYTRKDDVIGEFLR